MTSKDLRTISEFTEVLAGDEQAPISGAYVGDLLSDVMGNAESGELFITIQAHKNSIAVASLVGMPAIILCNSRKASSEMIEAAKEHKIALFESEKTQFEAALLVAKLLSRA